MCRVRSITANETRIGEVFNYGHLTTKFMKKSTKKNYVIYKNGEHLDCFLWDTCEGYSCVMDEVRRMKRRWPNAEIKPVSINEHNKIMAECSN